MRRLPHGRRTYSDDSEAKRVFKAVFACQKGEDLIAGINEALGICPIVTPDTIAKTISQIQATRRCLEELRRFNIPPPRS